MLPINGFESVEGAIGGLLEEQGDVLTELLLIVFDLDYIIGLRSIIAWVVFFWHPMRQS